MNKKLILTLTDVETGNVLISKDPARPEDVLAALQFLDLTHDQSASHDKSNPTND